MKKQILKIGNVLSKTEQKSVVGGFGLSKNTCFSDSDCCHFPHTQSYGYLCYDDHLPTGGYCAPGIFIENPCGL
ncbi:MAG: hypothetical protein Roseis2KO_48120 [Roseivirga sp.]